MGYQCQQAGALDGKQIGDPRGVEQLYEVGTEIYKLEGKVICGVCFELASGKESIFNKLS